MKHPEFGRLKRLIRNSEATIETKKARIKANLPVADHVKQEVEEYQAKRNEQKRKKGPRITLAEKLGSTNAPKI